MLRYRDAQRLILSMKIWPLPKRLPELSPMEPGWRSARKNVTYRLFDNKEDLGQAVKKHIEQEFKMNLAKFWS